LQTFEAVYKKGHNRLYYMKKLRSFNVCTKMLYKSVVESTVCIAAICWSSSIRARDSKKPNNLIKKAGSVLGTALEALEQSFKRGVPHKLENIKNNTVHPPHNFMLTQQ